MRKKLFFVCICILLVALIFSSCNDASQNAEGDNTSDSSESSNAENSLDATHTHTYGTWVTVKEASCTSEGSRTRVCFCGETETEAIAIIEHSYTNGVCKTCNQAKPSTFVPDYAVGEANTVGSDDSAYNYASQAGYIYFSNGNKIQKVNKSTAAVQLVYTASSGELFNVNVVGDWVYFFCKESTDTKSYIAKVKTDGSGFQTIVSSLNVWEMLVVKETVYYTTVTKDWTYKDYAKEIFPLYSISVNGGSPKQIHDGAVENLTADDTYLYYTYCGENDNGSICRIKHSNLNKSVLLDNTRTLELSLENSKLYFFAVDKYDESNCTLSSISISGGSYTTYGKMLYMGGVLHVIGNKAYFVGSAAPTSANPEPDFGLIECNLNNKSLKTVRNYYESEEFNGVFDCLICPSYNSDSHKLEYFEIYNPTNGTFKKVKIS